MASLTRSRLRDTAHAPGATHHQVFGSEAGVSRRLKVPTGFCGCLATGFGRGRFLISFSSFLLRGQLLRRRERAEPLV
jgi:hypothetical protein